MGLAIERLKMKKSKKIQLFLLLLLVIVFSFFFFLFFKKINVDINVFFVNQVKNDTKIIGDKVDNFLRDSSSFLILSKKYLENRLKTDTPDRGQINNYFLKKYIQSKRNLVSNYKYILEQREDRKNVSATYLSKNEVLTEEIKFITVVSESLDDLWKMFLKKYPFVTMTYVDKSGFYREFPFRKLEPNTISFLSDPRNYPYYSLATTIGRNEVFITLPYQNGNTIYISTVVPVYQKNDFRGLLTIDISLDNFERLIFQNYHKKDNNNQNIMVFDKKGNVYLYLIGNMANDLVNIKNLNEILKNQNKLLTKNIKIYPLITNSNIIKFIENFSNSENRKKIEVKETENYAVSLAALKSYNLQLLIIRPKNLFNSLNFINEIKNGIMVLIMFLVFLFVSLLYIIAQHNPEEKVALDFVNRISDSNLKETILTGLNESFRGNTLEILEANISSYIAKLNRQIMYLQTSLDNINMGVLVFNPKDKRVITNKWFKQLIFDVDKIDLMPEELKSEIVRFMSGNVQQFQKTIKLFDRHYLLNGEKINLTINNVKEELMIFTLFNAENLAKIKKENIDLKEKISELEKGLNEYKKSFEDLNSRIIQSDKFAVFGELIQGIVHNINNPLMIVTSRLSMVKTIIEDLDNSLEKRRLLKHMTNIINSLKKINIIIDSVLIKAKMTVEKEERLINLNDIIKSELEFFNSDLFFKHKVKRVVDLEPNLPKVRISQSDFSQVLHNLIKNALDALKSSSDPTLTIKTYSKNNFAVVEIIDNGPGVPDKYKDKIFEQYFTTKGSSGTGIGLYNARKILEEYDGELYLGNSKRGARFVIKIPIAEVA